MAWRPLPPHLRRRSSPPELLVALPTIIVTPIAGLLLLAGPIAIVLSLYQRDQHVAAAVLAPLALVWTVGVVREGVLPGLLVAWPVGVFALLQRARGRVDTLDLEDGRYVDLPQWRALTHEERDVLDVLLDSARDLPELRPLAHQAEVIAGCVCGCPSIRLLSRVPALRRTAEIGNAAGELDELAIAAVAEDGSGRPVDVVLRLHLGTVRELEITRGGVHDGEPDGLPPADRLRVVGRIG